MRTRHSKTWKDNKIINVHIHGNIMCHRRMWQSHMGIQCSQHGKYVCGNVCFLNFSRCHINAMSDFTSVPHKNATWHVTAMSAPYRCHVNMTLIDIMPNIKCEGITVPQTQVCIWKSSALKLCTLKFCTCTPAPQIYLLPDRQYGMWEGQIWGSNSKRSQGLSCAQINACSFKIQKTKKINP